MQRVNRSYQILRKFSGASRPRLFIAAYLLLSLSTSNASGTMTDFKMHNCNTNGFCLGINSDLAQVSSLGTAYAFDKANFFLRWNNSNPPLFFNGRDVFFDDNHQLIFIRQLDSSSHHKQAIIDINASEVSYVD